MPSDQLILTTFLFTIAFSWGASVLDFIGGNVYDVSAARQRRERQEHPAAKHFRHRPLISVVIPAHNEAAAIERCIAHLFKSSYRKFEVIVVDDASTDGTKQLVKELAKRYPKRTMKLFSKRKQSGQIIAAASGFKKFAHGEIIFVLDADTIVNVNTLKVAAHRFVDMHSDLAILNVHVQEYPSLMGLLQRFDYLRSNQSRKINSVLRTETFLDCPLQGMVFRHEVFWKLMSRKAQNSTKVLGTAVAVASSEANVHVSYINDALLFTEPATSIPSLISQRSRRQLHNWQLFAGYAQLLSSGRLRNPKRIVLRLMMYLWLQIAKVIELAVAAYFLYLAVVLKEPAMYIIVWAAATFIILFNVWINSGLSLRQRLGLTLYSPLIYHLRLLLVIMGFLSSCYLLIRKVGQSANQVIWQPAQRLTSQL